MLASQSNNQAPENNLPDALASVAYTLLGIKAARQRLKACREDYLGFSTDELSQFCAPIKERTQRVFCSAAPKISIVLRAHNEEREILPTIASYACLDMLPGLAELIVVDNCSNDRTAELIRAAGAKYVSCERKGIGRATRAGYDAIAPSCQYVFIGDADVRVSAPMRHAADFSSVNFLNAAFDYMESNVDTMGLSTGTVAETEPSLYAFVRKVGALLGRHRPRSYWSGQNQFFRKEALEAVGGINENVEFGSGEDHHRLYSVARYCKKNDFKLTSGLELGILDKPVYASARRVASISLMAKHIWYTLFRPKRRLGSDGWPVFDEKVATEKHEVRL